MSKRRKILVADLLCGAGGSTTGCERALVELGIPLDQIEFVCVNHWPTAIATHTLNHPKARHHVQDIATVRPHLIVPEGYLDLLMASPTCTHHSVARGGKPTSDQQRSDPWHIITWLTELRVKRIIIENVWEFTKWGPVNPKTMKPLKGREGEYFFAWIETIKRLGFDPSWRKLNAADYGDATTRQRFILMARSDRRHVHWPAPTHTKRPDDGLALFPGIRPWRSAREIIDWNLKGRSIFDRKKDLAPKTLERIYAGALKYKWPEAYLVILRRHMAGLSVDGPLPSITTGGGKGGGHIGLAQPVLFANRNNNVARSPDDPAPVFTTAHGGGVGIAEPVIVNMKGRSTATDVNDPLPTQTAHAGHLFSAEPIILSPSGYGAARSAEEPLPMITTGGSGTGDHPGCARPMLVEPFIATVAHGNSPGDLTADERRSKSIDDPLGAVTGGGAHALISPYYGSGETCTSAEESLPTITAKARFGMVVPVTHSKGGNGARDIAEPVPTMTTAKGGEFAVVMPVTHHDGSDRTRDASEPLPTITGAQHGERLGQAPRVHSVDDPTPTIAATGHVDLVVQAEGYDILFRMLEPHELAAAMGFNSDDQVYEFAGTKTDKIKQIGNAVSVAKMKACVGALMADAAPRQKVVPEAPQKAVA